MAEVGEPGQELPGGGACDSLPTVVKLADWTPIGVITR